MDHPTRLYLLRHGEVEETYHRTFGGRIDMNLSPRGHDQARHLAAHFTGRRLDAVYASPMKRAQQTAAPLLAASGHQAVTLDDLREVDFGAWTGLSWDAVLAHHGVSAFDWLDHLEADSIPGAESGAAFCRRVGPCLRRILASHAGEHAAVVCHGGVIRAALASLLDLPLPKTAHFEIDYASVTVVEMGPRRPEIRLLNHIPWPAHS